MNLSTHASTKALLGALALILVTVVILALVGKTPDGQMGMLIGGATATAAALAGFAKHDTPEAGTPATPITNATAVPPQKTGTTE